MVQLGMFRTSRVLVGAAVAAIAITTLGAGSAQAVVTPAYSTVFGPNCTTAVDTPFAGQTTKTDSTLPTVTSVAWNHLTVTAKANATARVTVKTHRRLLGCGRRPPRAAQRNDRPVGYPRAADMTWTVSREWRAQTWTFDIPLHGTDAGSISVTHVFVASDFQTASYDSTLTDPTLSDINFTPEFYSDSDYHSVAPPKAAKLVVKLATTLTVDASPEPVNVNHSVTVKATLKKLDEVDLRRGRLAVRDPAVPPARFIDVALDQEGQDQQQRRRQHDVQGHQEGHVRVPRGLCGLDVRRRGQQLHGRRRRPLIR